MNPIGVFIKKERLSQNMSQEALAEGICSNTYLSKIESGFSNVNEEIISLLIDALGYTYKQEGIDDYLKINESIWRSLLLFELEPNDYGDDLKKQLQSLEYSPVSLDVYLMKCLVGVLLEETLDDFMLELDLNLLSHEQRYRYYCILSYYDYSTNGKSGLVIDYHDEYGFISYYKTSLLFLEGKYRQAIKMTEKVYDMYAHQGNIMGMINISFLESSSYSNLNDLNRQIEISKRIETLNHYVKKDDVTFFINYNLGSSFLVQNEYEKAHYHLHQCLNFADEFDMEHVYEKLILLYLLTEEFLKAEAFLALTDESSLVSYRFLKRMLDVKNDLTDSICIKELERCYQGELNHHHGRSMLFGALLYSAYRATYQYPKAIKVLETLVYNEIPLFFKK